MIKHLLLKATNDVCGATLLAALLVLIAGHVSVRADSIDDYVNAQMRKNHIPGLSVAVIRDGRIEKLKGYGIANLEWNAPVSPDTAFQIASTTKPFTGTAVMMLVEEGKLSLDDPISKFLADAPASWQAISIRHLLTHSSGITDARGAGNTQTVESVVKAAYQRPLGYIPGEKSSYGLADYIVLTHIIEKVTGLPFTEFLQDRLFKPLGMKSTRFDNAVENGAIRASENIPYRATNYQWDQGMQKRFEFLFGNWTYSAGGLFSTAADIAKFIVALDSGRLLKPTSLEQMWASQKLGNGEVNSFGAGWVVKDYSGRRTVGHSGGPALSDILRFRDEKLTIVVLTNQQRLYPYLARGIADILIPPPAHKPFSGITDNDLQTTALLKKVLSDAAEGRVDPLLFSDEAQKGFVPSFKEFGPLVFGGFEPLQSFVLVEDKQNEDKKVRRYAALYGKKLVTWSFNLTRENKIESFEPKME